MGQAPLVFVCALWAEISGIPWDSWESLGFLLSPGAVSLVPSPVPAASAEPTFADPLFPCRESLPRPISSATPKPLNLSQTSLAGSARDIPAFLSPQLDLGEAMPPDSPSTAPRGEHPAPLAGHPWAPLHRVLGTEPRTVGDKGDMCLAQLLPAMRAGWRDKVQPEPCLGTVPTQQCHRG